MSQLFWTLSMFICTKLRELGIEGLKDKIYKLKEIEFLNSSYVIRHSTFGILPSPGRFNQFSNRCQVFLQAAHENIIVVGPGNF
jgi:hypothetical protein